MSLTKWYKDYRGNNARRQFGVDGKKYDLDIKNADFDWARSHEKVESFINEENIYKK